jgi:hypothetical protein
LLIEGDSNQFVSEENKMRENDEKSRKESDIAFALASFLLNVLILAVLCGGAWLLHSVIVQPNSSSVFLREYTMYR